MALWDLDVGEQGLPSLPFHTNAGAYHPPCGVYPSNFFFSRGTYLLFCSPFMGAEVHTWHDACGTGDGHSSFQSVRLCWARWLDMIIFLFEMTHRTAFVERSCSWVLAISHSQPSSVHWKCFLSVHRKAWAVYLVPLSPSPINQINTVHFYLADGLKNIAVWIYFFSNTSFLKLQFWL